METKQCSSCKEFFPATIENFTKRRRKRKHTLEIYYIPHTECITCLRIANNKRSLKKYYKNKSLNQNVPLPSNYKKPVALIKNCSTCGESFPNTIVFFPPDRRTNPNGLKAECKICNNKKSSIRQKRNYNKEKNSIRKKIYYVKNKEKVLAYHRKLYNTSDHRRSMELLRNKKRYQQLSDAVVTSYIIKSIKETRGIIVNRNEISPELIELKRKQLKLKRHVKKTKNNTDCRL